MKKKINAIIAALLIIALAGCGSQAQPSSSASEEKNAEAASGEPVQIVWWVYSDGDIPKDLDKVISRANEISTEKIGVTVDMKLLTEEQFDLDMTAGEYYDMTFTCDWCNDFDNNARAGYFRDITDLVPDVAPRLYEAVEPWWKIGELDGKIYGVPMLKDLGAEVFFRLNSDYFEGEKGMTLPEEMNFEDLEPLLSAWKQDNPDGYPLYIGHNGLTGMFQVHEKIVSDFLVIPYSKAGTDEGTKIIPVWEDEEYMSMLRCMHKWYEAGYINPDAATITELPYSLLNPVRSGTAWTGYKGWSDPETVGFNVKLVRYIGPNMSRATQQGSMIAINAAASEEKTEACLKYMELLYTDREFRDTLAYGLEGEHFEYYEDTVIRTDAGAENYLLDNFVTGPAVSASVVSASKENLADPDQWKKVYEGYKNAKESDTKGFSFDSVNVEAEVTALSALLDDRYHELVTGTVDPDKAMAELSDLMYKAGLQKVIDEAQRQLDEYLSL
ncbi:MAG: ABC transporter substrate-binding protein [Lachnospiraceae bacterium]|nr:ABC transporter substrate-binding protein [Lachnospiraceae bacterium]MBO6137086.1 ABC transporter substrate-binding protein [Lachnospiraceae bacterium]